MNYRLNKLLVRILIYVSILYLIVAGLFVSIPASANVIADIARRNVLVSPSQYALNYLNISFPSYDGLQLKGWWLKNTPNSPVIIMVHGFVANRAEPADRVFGIAKGLIEHGYSVFMFDLRAQGQSQGTSISGGYYERNDLLGAINYLRSQGVTSKIGVLGFSMGAATSLMTAAESQDLSAVVADSSFSDVSSVISAQLSQRSIPQFFVPVIGFFAKLTYGLEINKIKPIEAMKKITVPVLIIHGEADQLIPVDEAYELNAAGNCPDNQLWVVPGAGHTGAYSVKPQEYLDHLLAFFGNTLNS